MLQKSNLGVEKSIDGRQNLLKSGAFAIPILIAVVLIGLGYWQLSSFFNPERVKTKTIAGEPQTETLKEKHPSAAGLPAPRPPPSSDLGPQPGAASTSAAISGTIVIGGDTWLVLNTPEGMRIASPSLAYSRGVSAITTDERKAVPAYLNYD